MGKKQHISRLAAPKSWPITRKGRKWIAKPTPGTHHLQTSVPLVVLIRDVLCIAKTSKEVKKLLHSRELLVNQKVPKDIKFPVGLFDTLSIPKANLYYKIIFSKNGKLNPVPTKPLETNLLHAKIKSKNILSKGKTQLNLSNGWNIKVDKDIYKINDVVVLDLISGKIKEHLKFGIGKEVYVTAGKRLGSTGKLKELKKVGLLKKENIGILESGGTTFKTRVEYLFVKN